MQQDQFVRVRGARDHNLKNVDVDIPRDALVVFTGVSGSGKSSLAFGTLYAEAQRRYFESVSPYARRLIDQVGVPDVDAIEGLPPAVALRQQRGAASLRSSVGSVTTLSNLLRMLYSRAGKYPRGQPMLHAEDFSPNTPQGACPACHGLGHTYDVTEKTMVPDDSLSIRERAIAAWPPAWQGQNLRDILVTLGFDVDKPWRKLPKKDRDWILFTEEQPSVPVYAGFTPRETRQALRRKTEPSYQGTFMGARKYVLHTFATTQSSLMKKRAARFMIGNVCLVCGGRRLKRQALAVTFAGYDIAQMAHMSLSEVAHVLSPEAIRRTPLLSEEKRIAAQRIARNIVERIRTLQELGLGYLSLERVTPTLSPGELQRLRLATQIRSNLFGVVYVLDEPSAGLHPADTQALLAALDQLRSSGNSLFVVEHDLDVMRRAQWIVDVGPGAGECGGQILYSGAPDGLRQIEASQTARFLFREPTVRRRAPRSPSGWLILKGITRNNLRDVDVSFPLGVFTVVTGVSGSGKSSLVSQALVDLVSSGMGQAAADEDEEDGPAAPQPEATAGSIASGLHAIKRLVTVNQKPIGRTPRSNLATYTGLFDEVRKLFASTPAAKSHRYDAGRFSFNVAKGRCPTCEGEGFVCVELLFMPSVYAPCPACHGARYNEQTLKITYRGKNIADVLRQTVNEACEFFASERSLQRSLKLLQEIGLGYLRLGQPATELSGGEAQRIKLATELQRAPRGPTLYVIDEPTIGLHPSDVDILMLHLDALVDAGNTVIVAEHEMRVAAAADWIVDMGPGAGDQGGCVVASGTPFDLAADHASRTAPYLRPLLPMKCYPGQSSSPGAQG
ncbi:MAG TPA: excinuclease ABC subunit UvrA [Steroidobacteraceae bacterium]|jgi:excinuclease ABC subunit A|nr:excinuclease ABC subunit UvrA [Steroidobacteraceae bacterium]